MKKPLIFLMLSGRYRKATPSCNELISKEMKKNSKEKLYQESLVIEWNDLNSSYVILKPFDIFKKYIYSNSSDLQQTLNTDASVVWD